MIDISFGDDLAALDEAIEQVPNKAAVFLLWPKEGEPYLARTAMLGRRLRRLLKEREKPSRLLNLRQTVQRIEYTLTASRLESSVRMYDLARQHFPDKYAEVLKLRLPPYVKIVLQNEFPRSQITTHLSRTPAVYYGPFRSRATAERFESEFLDLFRFGGARMTWCLRPSTPVASTARWECASVPASRWWEPTNTVTKFRAS